VSRNELTALAARAWFSQLPSQFFHLKNGQADDPQVHLLQSYKFPRPRPIQSTSHLKLIHQKVFPVVSPISYCHIKPSLCHEWSQNLKVTEHQSQMFFKFSLPKSHSKSLQVPERG
jgi:hypothetical protein